MKKTALRDLLRNLLVAALPLAGAACSAPLDLPSGDLPRVADLADLSAPDFGNWCAGNDAGSGTAFLEAAIGDAGVKDCHEICPPVRQYSPLGQCSDISNDGGVQNVECVFVPHMCGRRTAGLEPAVEAHHGSALGHYFAAAAHLEAVSIHAFHRLARELATHGAPSKLITAARRAAREEAHHARLMTTQARRFGATVPAVRITTEQDRSLEAIAIENAVEGCVGETYGALTAMWQAASASDPEVRAALCTIAEDETSHAELAWQVHGWLDGELDDDARARVGAERRAAIARLRAQLSAAETAELAGVTGLPGNADGLRLLADLEATLWA